MVALLHSDRSEATMLSTPPASQIGWYGVTYLPRDGPLTTCPRHPRRVGLHRGACRAVCRPREHPQARDRDDRGADQRRLAVPEGVQDHGDEERADEPEDLPAARGGGRRVQRRGGDAGPRHVPGRAQESAQQQDVDGVGDVAAALDQRGEGVAHGLQRGEPGAAGDADEQAVRGRAVAPQRDQQGQWDEQLAGLLDQPDAEHGQAAQRPQDVELKGGGDDRADHAAEERRGRDGRPGHAVGQAAAVDERDEGQRDDARPEQDRRRDEVRVLGRDERALLGDEQGRADDEHHEPGMAAGEGRGGPSGRSVGDGHESLPN